MLVLTSETLLFVVFTAIVWYEFLFSMSAFEMMITIRVLTLLGGIGCLLFFALGDLVVEEGEEGKEGVDNTCPSCTSKVHASVQGVHLHEIHEAAAAEEPPSSPKEDSDEFADLLEPTTKQIPTPT